MSFGFLIPADNDPYLKIARGLDIFGKAYREIAFHYVEAVDPEELMKYGIEQMLESLDPYTVFIDDTRGDELEMLTSGRYGGIGVTVAMRDSQIYITAIIEDRAAFRAGVRVEDVIVSVDSVDVHGMRLDAVRALVRGAPGSTVRLRVKREDAPQILEFVMVREEIVLRNVTCARMVDSSTGYIKLEHFTRGAGEEVRTAVRDLRRQGASRLVLDLRDNPGGLLDQAVAVVEQFVPRGNVIVTTRGRGQEPEHQYRSEQEPVAVDLPLAVLVNRESASASEIVAGALQDLDRAVIVGTRTYGKGLVQTVTPLPYNTSLKITTAKYYTPSGRCIQEIDYARRRGEIFLPFPDSARKTFYTRAKRPVREEGGVTPDSTVTAPIVSDFIAGLDRKNIVRPYFVRQDTAVLARRTPQELVEDFLRVVRDARYQYAGRLTMILDSAMAEAKGIGAGPDIVDGLAGIRSRMATEWEHALRGQEQELRRKLEFAREQYLHGSAAAIGMGLKYDRAYQTASALLSSPTAMHAMLGTGD